MLRSYFNTRLAKRILRNCSSRFTIRLRFFALIAMMAIFPVQQSHALFDPTDLLEDILKAVETLPDILSDTAQLVIDVGAIAADIALQLTQVGDIVNGISEGMDRISDDLAEGFGTSDFEPDDVTAFDLPGFGDGE